MCRFYSLPRGCAQEIRLFRKFLGGPYHGSKRRRLRTLIFAAKYEFMLHCRSCVVIGDGCRIESSITVNVLDKIDYRRKNVANLGFSATIASIF